jgi:hypothetical protein
VAGSGVTRIKRQDYYAVRRGRQVPAFAGNPLPPSYYQEDGGRMLLQIIVRTTPYDVTLKLDMRDRPFPPAVPLEARTTAALMSRLVLFRSIPHQVHRRLTVARCSPQQQNVRSVAPEARSYVITGKGSHSLAVLRTGFT